MTSTLCLALRTLDLLIIPKDGILLWKPAAAAAYTCAYCIYKGGWVIFVGKSTFCLIFVIKILLKLINFN